MYLAGVQVSLQELKVHYTSPVHAAKGLISSQTRSNKEVDAKKQRFIKDNGDASEMRDKATGGEQREVWQLRNL